MTWLIHPKIDWSWTNRKVKQTVKGRLSSQSSASPDESLFNLIKSTKLGKEKEWKGEIKLKCTDDIPRHACA